jgi:ABC-2 type transport system permease protein
MRLIAGTQYRAAAWAGVATQFFWGGMELLIYAAFYRSGAGNEPFPYAKLADLIWMRQAFLALVALWSQDNELLDMVVKGNIAYELCRPLDLYSFWFARIFALRLSRVALRCLPILIIAAFLPEPYRFHPPSGVSAALCFILALTFAAFLVVAVSMFIYLVAFITLNSYGPRVFIGVSSEFLMGALIPIPLMPPALQRVLAFLPFRYMADFPFRVYSGSIAGREALIGLCIQAFWLVVLMFAGRRAFVGIQKRIVVQGG